MRIDRLVCLVLVAAAIPVAAVADDPKDPAMRNAAARARDHQMVGELNRQELASVRERDARWAAAGNGAGGAQDHGRAMANYARDRAQYERELAAWHRAVAACRAGDYSACER
jgi:hypothetical protein